jgi:glucose/arabinose dehydrogenase
MRRMDLPCARRAGIGLALGVLAAVGCTRSSSKPTPTTTTTSPSPTKPVSTTEVLLGRAAFGDFTQDAPGLRRKITAADLPPPFATKSADAGSKLVARPPGALPRVPDGFKVAFFAGGLTNPRMARVAPNGDLFVVESKANRVRVLRDADGDGTPEVTAVFTEGLNQPFGVGFYPPDNPAFVYVANTDSVVRYPYAAGDTKARGPAEVLVNDISGGGRLRGGGHWTRDLVFSRDAKKMFVSVGSRSNADDGDAEARRARIFEFTPDGKNERVYATGLRNAVGLAVHPITGELWASVNERDELGDDLVPDYITHVKDGGFYGWPWFYIGANQDPHHEGKHPELRASVIVPDVLVQSHSASLGMTFYTGDRFPAQYKNGAFAAEHGSWNRTLRTGYKVIFVPTVEGHATGEYVDFMTGFVLPNGEVWGRPVAVAQTKDGSLFVTDDGGDCVWLVTR